MAAPATCVITFPTTGWTVGAAPNNTATLSVTGTTDPSTPVELFDGVTSKGTSTSNGSGAFTFTSKVFAIGDHSLTVVAGTDPDTTTSAAVTLHVIDVIAAIDDPNNRSMQWYLNFLAGETVYNIPGGSMLSCKDAACNWAGVSKNDYTLLGALNAKATNTVGIWLPVNQVLNQLADPTGFNAKLPCLSTAREWLTDAEALYAIALAEQE